MTRSGCGTGWRAGWHAWRRRPGTAAAACVRTIGGGAVHLGFGRHTECGAVACKSARQPRAVGGARRFQRPGRGVECIACFIPSASPPGRCCRSSQREVVFIPLHYRIVRVAYDINATVLFGTNTFLTATRVSRIRTILRALCLFGRGASGGDAAHLGESSACASSRATARRRRAGAGDEHRDGQSPGRRRTLLPSISMRSRRWRGRAWRTVGVRGPNVMLGYLRTAGRRSRRRPNAKSAGTIPATSCRSTGTAMSHQGRAKRFAKVGGEMVSLAVAERCDACLARGASRGIERAGCAGDEQLVLVTEQPDAERAAARAGAHRRRGRARGAASHSGNADVAAARHRQTDYPRCGRWSRPGCGMNRGVYAARGAFLTALADNAILFRDRDGIAGRRRRRVVRARAAKRVPDRLRRARTLGRPVRRRTAHACC